MKFNEDGIAVFENEALSRDFYLWNDVGNLNFATMHLLSKIYASNVDTFYASDFEINGGCMNAFTSIKFWDRIKHEHCFGFVPTGNTRSTMVEVGDNLYKKVEVKEWKINREIVKIYLDLYREGVKFALGE